MFPFFYVTFSCAAHSQLINKDVYSTDAKIPLQMYHCILQSVQSFNKLQVYGFAMMHMQIPSTTRLAKGHMTHIQLLFAVAERGHAVCRVPGAV